MKFLWPLLALCMQFPALSQSGATVYFHVDKLTIKNKIVADSTFAKRYKEKAATEFALQGYTGLFISDSTIKSDITHYYFSYSSHFEKIVLVPQKTSTDQKIKPIAQKDYLAALKN